jgi:hypothetical protein
VSGQCGDAVERVLAALAQHGSRRFHVFPCLPGDKRPAVDRWEHRACSDPDRVVRFWPSPRHNIGIACGPSRLVVVDLDTHGEVPEEWRRLGGIRDGWDVLAQLCEWAGQPWPCTYSVTTPSGGAHLYFRAPEGSGIRNSAGMLGPLVDVRAQGGYVVGAGSVVDGKRYEVMDASEPAPLPGWLHRMLTKPADSPRPSGGSVPARIAALARTVETAPEGRRNDVLFWASNRVIEAGLDPADLVPAAVTAGLSEREARRTIASAMVGR